MPEGGVNVTLFTDEFLDPVIIIEANTDIVEIRAQDVSLVTRAVHPSRHNFLRGLLAHSDILTSRLIRNAERRHHIER